MFSDPLVARIAAFVRGIGIDVHAAQLNGKTFFPGIEIRYGALWIDETRLSHPGDILHEAGHVAVADPAERQRERLSLKNGGDEMATIAWSYAAARHLEVPADVLFHPDQHNGHSASLIENFTAGRYFGVPLLQYYGMTFEPRRAEQGVEPYPHMLRWLR